MTIANGARLGPYEIVMPIGAGGMGEVFRARDTRLGRDVALKILPTLFATDPERLRRFEQEARASAALNHPNILVVYDVGTDAGVPYVVSELLEGQTLREILARGALPVRKAVDYGAQAASGLAAAHEKGIVHRDLKPENLFVTKDGRVKILDFGLAKLAEAASADGSRATLAQTDPGMVVGTMGYMSPEQLRGETVDARSDVFSLGAVLYEMFAGQRAFKGKTAVDTMSAILKEDPPEFPSGVHVSSPALERIVRRCLEKNVEERFQSARDVTFALEALSTGSGMSAPVAILPVPWTRRAARPLVGIAALAIVAVGAYALGGRSGAPAAPPSVTQLTFRSGTVRGARFAPDGRTVIYAAAWEGDPITLFTTRPGSPESSGLPLPPSDLFAISPTGEMALALNAKPAGPFNVSGTLARAPIAGGAPRELLENIMSADWTPDGAQLAAIRSTPTSGRLEFPIGTERVTTPYWLGDARVSPDGAQVAFIAHPQGGDEGEVQVVGRTGAPRTISKGWLSIQGLDWAPGGRELWFTATRAGMLRALWAVTLDGRERLLYRVPIRLMLEDVASDGRALLTGMTLRTELRFGSLRGKTERSLSWFDWGTSLSMSDDARLVAFTESGEGAGARYGVFLRPTDGGPAVRLGDGGGTAISPDGKWVLALMPGELHGQLLPTGAGAPRTIDLSRLKTVANARWFHDSRRMVIVGQEAGHQPRSYELDVASGRLTPLTPEGTVGSFISPDGQWLAAAAGTQRELLNLQTHAALPATVAATDRVVGWSADSKAVFMAQVDERRARLFRLDVPSGARTSMGALEPSDPAGLTGIGGVSMAPDGDHYVYGYSRQLSQLYLVDLKGR